MVAENGILRPLMAALVLAASLFSPAFAANYDISYLWHSDRSSVSAYRDRVTRILGPEVAGRLRVVRGRKNYGLIYRRRGGYSSARKVAEAHSRLLAARGLERAVPILSRNWNSSLRPVYSRDASALENNIEEYIKGLRRRGRIKPDERTAWVVYDFFADEKMVSINEDIPMEAASLIKPFIVAAYFYEVSAGRRKYGSLIRRRMEDMIRESDNRATNWLLRRMGGPRAVERLLKKHYGGIFKDTRLVEYIPSGGRTYRNKASAHDYSRFLYALWKGHFPYSGEIKRLMALPNADRFYTSTPGVPVGTEVYDKTGTTSHLCGDMGVMVAKRGDGKEFPYIIIGIIEKDNKARSYWRWMRTRGDAIRGVSEIVYKAIAEKHRFGHFRALKAESSGK